MFLPCRVHREYFTPLFAILGFETRRFLGYPYKFEHLVILLYIPWGMFCISLGYNIFVSYLSGVHPFVNALHLIVSGVLLSFIFRLLKLLKRQKGCHREFNFPTGTIKPASCATFTIKPDKKYKFASHGIF